MSLHRILQVRSLGIWEFCSTVSENLQAYAVAPKNLYNLNDGVVICETCKHELQQENYGDANHWRCLSGSIWSEVPAVQAMSLKILNKLKAQDWAAEIVESVGLEESVVNWANAEDNLEASKIIHKDAYGNVLESGDTVQLIQNLNVKGTSYIAPKGTIVRKIRLVPDNEEQIEGKINGDTIVILTKFLKKS